MNWRAELQHAVDEAKAKTGEIEPERIFVNGLPFEQTEWTSLRCNDYIMEHFDLVLELKRLGTSIIADIIPDTINGYKVKFIFEITPPEFVRTGCATVRFIASLYCNGAGKATAFGRLETFDLNFERPDEYFTRMTRFRIEEDTQKLLLCLCRAANEKRREEESIDTIVTALRDCYDIFYQPEPLTLQKDWKAEADKWETMYRTVAAQLDRTSATLYSTETALKAMKNRVRKAEGTYIHSDDDETQDDEVSAVEWKARYEAERKMRMELQSKVIALNAQLAAEKGILLG